MRKLIGSVVLIAGVGGLGYVGMTQQAAHIQSAIMADATALSDTLDNAVTARVSGRDIVLSGIVPHDMAVQSARGSFLAIDGVRIVDVSAVQTYPVADPFELMATKADDGAFTLTGVAPTQASKDRMAQMTGVNTDALTLAAGMPDNDWPLVAQLGLLALKQLNSGDVSLSGQTITLRGVVNRPVDRDAAIAMFDGISDAYTLIPEIDVLDNGTPLRLSAGLRDGGLDVSGKFPNSLETDIITDRFQIAEMLDIETSVLPAEPADWPQVVEIGLDALSGLIEADLQIVNTNIQIAGVGSPDGLANAEALLATLPDTYTVTNTLSIYGADFDLRLNMDWDGTSANAGGTFPLDFTPRGPAGVAVTSTGQTLFLPDDDGAFTANANAGVAALGLLDTGTLTATKDSIILTGTATSPQVGLAMDTVLTNAATGTDIQRDLTYLDDGSPAAWALRYTAETGAEVEGRLPTGVTPQTLADALGLPGVAGTPATALEDADAGSSADTLTLITAYLPEIETLTYAIESGSSALDIVLSPGVDVDLVATDLAERLPTDVAFSLTVLDDLPANGTTRKNQATGLDQIFTDGFWLPNVTFAADETSCTAQTQDVLARAGIGFLSSSARLDATSVRAINALAAVALPCTQAGLTFEVGGHTDATGSELDNQDLSTDRANAVRTALISRGIPAEAITAFGFGQSQPIADNSTPEGRAANRRTDITWYAPGALRDP